MDWPGIGNRTWFRLQIPSLLCVTGAQSESEPNKSPDPVGLVTGGPYNQSL